MATVKVDPGICGFKTVIHAECDDMQTCTLTIHSSCPNIGSITIEGIDAYQECCFVKCDESQIMNELGKTLPHIACPIPTAALKAVEVAAGLALPADVSMTIEK